MAVIVARPWRLGIARIRIMRDIIGGIIWRIRVGENAPIILDHQAGMVRQIAVTHINGGDRVAAPSKISHIDHGGRRPGARHIDDSGGGAIRAGQGFVVAIAERLGLPGAGGI